MRVNELTGHALNWAVAQAEGDRVFRPRLGRPADWDKEAYLKDGSDDRWVVRVQNPKVAHFVDWTYNPSGDWWQGGEIIEREWIEICRLNNGEWRGQWYEQATEKIHREYGDTPLIAAMRCYVASKLGDEVEIPTELTQGENK
jgi:hypothetical protein